MKQHKISQKQIQAMQSLRQISESPWLIDTKIEIHKSADISQRKIKTVMSNPNRRPLTQQVKIRNKNLIMYTQKRQTIYQNILKAPVSEEGNLINFSKEVKKNSFFQPTQTEKQMSQSISIGSKKHNYTDLRKTFQRDFFIGGAKSISHMNHISNLQRSQNLSINCKNSKKGRLWLGRPILLFNSPNSLRLKKNKENSKQKCSLYQDSFQ